MPLLASPSPRREPRAIGVRLGVAGAVLAYSALSTLTAVGVRPFRPADESANIAYAVTLLEEGRIPHAREVVDPDLPGQVTVRQHTAKHPPLYYAMQAGVLAFGRRLGHPMWGFFAARLLSVVFGSLTVVLVGLVAYELAGRQRRTVPIAAALYAGTLTPFVVIGGLVHNDALAAMFATLAVLGLIRVFTRGFDRLPLAAVFAGCALGLLVRVQAIGVVSVCGVGLVAAAAWQSGRWSWRDARRGMRWAGLLGLACLTTSGWFYWFNYDRYGDPTGGIAAAAKSDREYRGHPFVPLFLDWRIWLSLFLNVRAHIGHPWRATNLGVSVGVLGLLGAGVVSGAVRAARRWVKNTPPNRSSIVVAVLLGLLVVEMVTMTVRHLVSGGNLHNRYMAPAIGVVATAAALALLALPAGRRGPFAILVSAVQMGISLVYIGYLTTTGVPPEVVPRGGLPEGTLARLQFGIGGNGLPAPFLFVLLAVGAAGLSLASWNLLRVADVRHPLTGEPKITRRQRPGATSQSAIGTGTTEL